MTSLPLGPLQRSIVEVDIIDGERCEDEPSFDVDAVEAHLLSKGRLLLLPGVYERVSDISDGASCDPSDQGPRHAKSAMGLWEKAWRATR